MLYKALMGNEVQVAQRARYGTVASGSLTAFSKIVAMRHPDLQSGSMCKNV
jgi:hypothetical protein